MALNGTVVTQRSYSTRLGMMDQDVLAVQASKTSDMKSNEPFIIERKTMQRSYGLNIILSGSKKHKHGGEGLIFVPQGTGTKFYDYVTPEPALALEWHTSTPDNKIAEFWWDLQWPTQMFERGYGLETRTGGWRFYRVREDKKDIDDEATVLALVKELETSVTKQQLESQIDHIRTQWKAREAGTSSNGTAQSSNPIQRLPVRSLSINNSHTDGQPALATSLSSHYLQSPSTASQSGSLGYFPKKDQERKSSVDDYGSSNSHSASTSGTFSHPLPPKPPPFQSRQMSTDPSQPQSVVIGNSNSTKSADQEHGSSPSPTISSSASSNQIVRKSTPPPVTSPVASSSTLSYTSSSATSTSAASPVSATATKNPLKLSQVQAHLQPIKSWMTVSPIPRTPLSDKSVKTIRSERRDSRDSITGSTSPRSVSSSSRKSSMSIIDTSKEVYAATPNAAFKFGDTTGATENSPASMSSALSTSQENQPQTPTPAHTPTPAGMSRPIVTPAPPPTLALPPTSIALPIAPCNVENKAEDEKGQNVDPSFADDTTKSTTLMTANQKQNLSEGESTSVLGKRAVEPYISAEYRSEDSLAQRRKVSDGLQYSPKAESPIISIGIPSLAASRSPKSSNRSPLAEQYGDQQVQKLSPLLSPISSPGTVAVSPDDRQTSPRPSHSSRPRAITGSKLFNELSTYVEGSIVNDDTTSVMKDEIVTVKADPALPRDYQGRIKGGRPSIAVGEDVDMKNDSASSAATTESLPTPALTIAEQIAYQPPTNHDKALTMAKARVEAMSRMEKQAEEQTAKVEKMQEDIERFKENSRMRNEKAQKRKLQETIEAPVQDRRAQPVRQINQQQGRQLNSDAPVQRGQSQSAQRHASSPQDQQRPGYPTRQSKAAFRTEAQQSAQNSPKTQPRTEQYPGQQKELIQPSGEPSPLPTAQKEQRTTASDPNSPNPGRSDQQTVDMPKQKMLHPSEATRHHKRINSMDQQLHMSQSLSSLLPDQTTADQRELSERLYGHPYSKRLDISQHGELNHRRSHSDVGILYKPVTTAIVQPQPMARVPQQGQTIRDGPPMQRNLSPVRPNIEHRQGTHPPLTANMPTALHSGMDSSSTRNNNSFLSVTKEATPTKRESKARLQFILNDEDSGPESYGEEDPQERRSSPEASHWSQRNPAQESTPKTNAPPMEFGARSPYTPDYGVIEHQGMHALPNVPTSVMDPSAARRQSTKKLKLSQDVPGMDQHFDARTDEYEYHLRQSHMHSLPPRGAPHSSQRSAPQPDRWPQQVHPPPPHPIPSTLNHTQPHIPGRRNPGDGQVAPPGPQQQVSHSNTRPAYSGPEQPLHGSQAGRPLHHEQYSAPGSLAAQEGPRPPERPTHSRHSSMTKATISLEQSHPQGPSYQATRVKSTQPHGPPDQYNRGYPPPSLGQPSGQVRPVSQSQQQQAQYHQQQQQTAAGVSARKKAPTADEPHAGTFGGPQGLGAHAGYESRASHPQHLHSHQQAMQQQQQRSHTHHPSSNRHPEQEPVHDVEPPPGHHKQSQAPPQFRAVHHEQASAAGPQSFYEQEAHAANFGSGRSSMYGSQPLHPSSAPEKQPASYPPYHVAGSPHDPSYRPYPGSGGMRSSSGNDLPPKDDHVRGGLGARGSANHLPPEHAASLHPSQRQHPQHPQHAPPQNSQQQQQQSHDYRHGSASFHHQQQQQYPPQQKSMHVQDHPQYPPHHNPGQKVSSPRHGQLSVGGHPSEHDPNYRPQIPHGQGQGPGQAHGRGHAW
ncbi:hypothetical protein BGZ58_001653 [Dissophora ornata]|nr:hypothetical protein BGZ58_001653 [Dissophora ornata]